LELGTWDRIGSLTDAFGAGSALGRPNIGLARGLDPLLENSEIVERSAGGGGGKDEIVDLAEMSAPTEEMCEVFSAGIDVKVVMLETAPSDGDTRVGNVTGMRPILVGKMRTWEKRRGRTVIIQLRATQLVFLFAVSNYPVILPLGHYGSRWWLSMREREDSSCA
jgi:hypothetical protein